MAQVTITAHLLCTHNGVSIWCVEMDTLWSPSSNALLHPVLTEERIKEREEGIHLCSLF